MKLLPNLAPKVCSIAPNDVNHEPIERNFHHVTGLRVPLLAHGVQRFFHERSDVRRRLTA